MVRKDDLPANIKMAIDHVPFGGHALPGWALLARLLLLLVFIA